MAKKSHSEFFPTIVPKNTGINLEWPKILSDNFWLFLIYTSLFGKKNIWKNLEQPFMAILNFPPTFWENCREKIWNGHFWPFQIYTSPSGINCPKNLEWLFLAILNFTPSFWEKLSEKIQNSHFWPFQIFRKRWGKIQNGQK